MNKQAMLESVLPWVLNCSVLVVGAWIVARLVSMFLPRYTKKELTAASGNAPESKVEKPSAQSYGKDDLRRDLLDGTLAIEEILAKCTALTPEEIEEVAKEVGTDRRAERLAWYATMLRRAPLLKVVKPPPQPPPVVTVTGQTLKCPYCGG